ncbi:MAG: late competence development ComFB family protein [Anaeromicrobium sp.]|uniref:late competence development ComFB family protein n=1 Tax=Anaeromicrobium sp. TaxID=1929132 RepID=UPI0025CEA367|nr:late competence development ComFB family protein [Anaeromicrobium sp.]MCT4595799.1 late competence development ComFB family protein [Anaeromicrobium sp.]
MLKNYMEYIVDNLLQKTLNEYPFICTCSMCKTDIKAIALNNLKPMYVATADGESYLKANSLDRQFLSDVVAEIAKAIEIVSSKPRHDL